MTISSILIIITLIPVLFVSGRREKPWNELVFTQQWSPSVCIQAEIQKSHTCVIPANVTTWTVHGLWPTQEGSFGPNYCNDSDKYHPEKLKSIMDDLMKYWPNLFTDEDTNEFWKHEWVKHGTCAEELDTLGSELKYFTAGLKLNRQYDLLKMLSGGLILPKDNSTYQLAHMQMAFQSALGLIPKMQCFLNEAKTVQFLVQIEVCLNKQFQVIPCTKASWSGNSHLSQTWRSHGQRLRRAGRPAQNEPCSDRLGITYPSFNHLHG